MLLVAGASGASARTTPHLSMKTALGILHRIEQQQVMAPGGNWEASGDDCTRKSSRHIECAYAITDTDSGYNCAYRLDVYRHVGSRHPTWRDALQARCYYFSNP